ncbi:uncharacterized protein LOC124813738 isoform X1 [Hydra vulgaris]|uniref:uncharacterized protein LOC124813738 isoform X1 n=1 Tax=Hydra vulgaris TaxID=6087 RepID=UPI001F5E9F5A|nr:uncharacterized protein LOC124813738 [Hydra vulgaris]
MSKKIQKIPLQVMALDRHDNNIKAFTDLTRSDSDIETQVLQRNKDLNENVSWSTLPRYESLIEEFIIDEPPKFEIVTGEKLHIELESINNESISNNNSNSRQSTKCEKCILAFILVFSLSTVLALIIYGFLNHLIS